MLETIEEHLKAISLVKIKTKEESESFRISYLGKKGILQALFSEFKTVKPEDKKKLWGRL